MQTSAPKTPSRRPGWRGGLKMGTNKHVSGAYTPPNLLLDTYTGAVVAYSAARKLRNSYAGSAIRVRRSSDNAEQDIGFDGSNNLDVTALNAFVGANDGLIVTWYDQSGNGRNVTQATAANQPAIILAGVLQTQGSNARPSIKFDGSNDFLTSSAFNPNTPTLLGYWIDRHDTTNTAHMWGLISGTIDGKEMRVRAPGDAATTNMRISVNSTTSTALTSVPANTDKVGRARAQADGTPVRALRINKGTEATGTPTTDTGFVASKPICIGAEDSGATPYNGVFGELIVFPTFAYTADNAIDDNIMNYWGVV